MKKAILIRIILVSFSLLLIAVEGSAQKSCPVVCDSILAGEGAGSYTDFFYDALGRISQVHFYDSGRSECTKYILNTYDEKGRLAKSEFFRFAKQGLRRDNKYTYKEGKLARID